MTQLATASKGTKPGCPFCQKQGLPILPVRYAIARDDISGGRQAPRLSSPFGNGVQNIKLPSGQRYSLRLLRPGYLYVCNEKRGSWDAYVVTEKGYLYPFAKEIKHSVLEKMNPDAPQSIDALLIPPKESIEFSCQREPDHPYLARCIMIPNAESAERVWIGFSDTPWTKRIWKAHTRSSERAKHMRELRLDLWKGGTHSHAQRLSALSAHLAEAAYSAKDTRPDPAKRGRYLSEMAGQPPAFGHSPQAFYGMADQVQGLVDWADKQAKRLGFCSPFVAINDPVGITLETAQMIRLRVEIFEKDKSRDWKYATSTTIVGMRKALEEQAVYDALQQKRNVSNVSVYTMADGSYVDASAREGLEDEVWEQHGLAKLNATEEERARDNAWDEYLNDYNEKARADFDKELERDTNDYANSTLFPLGESFVSWYTSAMFRETMACNHDDVDLKSGEAMTQLVAACLHDIVGVKPVGEALLKELQANFTEKRNTILRAMLLNNSEAAAKLQKAAVAELELANPGAWSNVFKAFAHVMEKGREGDLGGALGSVARLVYSVSSPLVTLLGRSGRAIAGGGGQAMISLAVRYRLVALLGVISGKPLRRLKIRASEAELAHIIVDELARANSNVDKQALRRQIDRQVRIELSERKGARTPISGARNARGRRVFHWTVFWDDEARRLFNGSNIDQLDNALLREDQLRSVLRSRTASAVKLDIGLGTAALVLDGWNAYQALTDLPDPKKGTPGQRQWQLIGALTSLAGSSVELGGKVLDRRPWGQTKLVRPFKFFLTKVSTRGAFVGFLGKVVGTVGAFIGAVLDFGKAWKARQEGDNAIFLLYTASGFLGVVIAFLVLGGLLTAGVGFVLMLALALLGMLGEWLINVIRDNKVEVWLDKTVFGRHRHGRFNGLDEQEAAYQTLIKA
ncbi:conserved membrane hypothetical protein [Cupriavidus taiwanensis]|uniref:Toxin VasX N-terminal region domain-containing protein n=1 Tax=Cupriavidus taiwanensis TaxID=164546 RepID=A0A375E6W0_9BURK|nr:T6SS effector BTH_I2691 family protein [Cupriavidus taiwanensis]SOZ63291.1 conserved membrane hypothetical protein [Cupriavidus taiwanensis]SOZ64209.1 conserved membrane hypothetical protein [Cupriavidus taiwanensis]SOZ67975.1 conserved membrane hypothetical protein [Cupriavidus taiwanensis]SPA01379.1 conserved membrane hypothetical protein [Cupriavidus taiwanensis]SPA07843.1 conserved membrane hypothetical protein [Cupriavidus taiwanensis]